jgi:hypothetical protein
MSTSMWDAYIPPKSPFFVEVTVRDMHPSLTGEEALIGTRRINSAVNTVRVQFTGRRVQQAPAGGGKGEGSRSGGRDMEATRDDNTHLPIGDKVRTFFFFLKLLLAVSVVLWILTLSFAFFKET